MPCVGTGLMRWSRVAVTQTRKAKQSKAEQSPRARALPCIEKRDGTRLLGSAQLKLGSCLCSSSRFSLSFLSGFLSRLSLYFHISHHQQVHP